MSQIKPIVNKMFTFVYFGSVYQPSAILIISLNRLVEAGIDECVAGY